MSLFAAQRSRGIAQLTLGGRDVDSVLYHHEPGARLSFVQNRGYSMCRSGVGFPCIDQEGGAPTLPHHANIFLNSSVDSLPCVILFEKWCAPVDDFHGGRRENTGRIPNAAKFRCYPCLVRPRRFVTVFGLWNRCVSALISALYLSFGNVVLLF